MSRDSIEKLARKLAEAVPSGLQAVRDDVEKNFRSVLTAGLAKMDLVSREEFDVQTAVLQRTRQKLLSLEERMSGLESSRRGVKKPGRKKTAAKKSTDKNTTAKTSKARNKKSIKKSTPGSKKSRS